jgi:hypothetical protein
MNAIVDFGKVSFDVPAERFALFFFEPLKFLDQIELKFDGDPRGELKGDVLMSVCAAIAPGLGDYADGVGFLDPLLGGEDEAVESCLVFNPIEFDGIKIGIVQVLPNAEELDRVPISHPIHDNVVRPVWVFVTRDVGKADVIFVPDSEDRDLAAENLDPGHWRGLLNRAHTFYRQLPVFANSG